MSLILKNKFIIFTFQDCDRLTLYTSRIVIGEGKFEEMMVASQEIAGSTAQLVIASRVRAFIITIIITITFITITIVAIIITITIR